MPMAAAELTSGGEDFFLKGRCAGSAMLPEQLKQARIAKLLTVGIACLRNAVREKKNAVAGGKLR